MGGKTQPITGREVRKSDGIYTTIKYMILGKKQKYIGFYLLRDFIVVIDI